MDGINLQNVTQCEEPIIGVNSEQSERSKAVLRGNHKRPSAEIEDFRQTYAANRNVAEGIMDIALLTANANQLRFLITYNYQSSTFYINVGLIILSLILQVAVGIALIFKRKNLKNSRMIRTNQFLVGGVFMITFINILVAALTSTDNNTKVN